MSSELVSVSFMSGTGWFTNTLELELELGLGSPTSHKGYGALRQNQRSHVRGGKTPHAIDGESPAEAPPFRTAVTCT